MRKMFDFTKAIFWVGLILAIYIFALLTNESTKSYHLRQKEDQLQAQISQLQADIEELGYKISYYQTDEYREKLAREKLNMRAPGESVVIIRGQNQSNATPATAALQEEKFAPKSNTQTWLDFLSGS